jgi:hypothetical protein
MPTEVLLRITEIDDGFHKTSVILAKAGIYFATVKNQWIPAFAGMTIRVLTVTHFRNAQQVQRSKRMKL